MIDLKYNIYVPMKGGTCKIVCVSDILGVWTTLVFNFYGKTKVKLQWLDLIRNHE